MLTLVLVQCWGRQLPRTSPCLTGNISTWYLGGSLLKRQAVSQNCSSSLQRSSNAKNSLNTKIQIKQVIAWDDLYSLLQRWIRNHIARRTLARLIVQSWLFLERILFQNCIVVTTGQRATIVVKVISWILTCVPVSNKSQHFWEN